eukprot:2829326-Lingulodinium_polyedra.AAC.1
MARAGVDDMLRSLQSPDALVGSFFAETNGELAGAVERAWNGWAEAGGGCPHSMAASNVWGTPTQWSQAAQGRAGCRTTGGHAAGGRRVTVPAAVNGGPAPGAAGARWRAV